MNYKVCFIIGSCITGSCETYKNAKEELKRIARWFIYTFKREIMSWNGEGGTFENAKRFIKPVNHK